MGGDEGARASSSEEAEARLEDNAGIGTSPAVAAFDFARAERRAGSATEAWRACDCGAQQKVSLFHSRHERFSRRLPSCMTCDVLENKECIPKRASTLVVSIVCKAATSTRSSGSSGLKGIVEGANVSP